MLRLLFRSYKPLIRFRKGAAVYPTETPAKSDNNEYHSPLYLRLRPAIDPEELDVINAGGKTPTVHWKKVSLSNKK